MVKAVIPGIYQHSLTFIRYVLAKFGTPNLLQSPGIEENSDGGISNFWISSQ